MGNGSNKSDDNKTSGGGRRGGSDKSRDNDSSSSSLYCSHLQHLFSGAREPLAVLTTVYACVVPVCVEPAREEPDIVILSCHVEVIGLTQNFPGLVGIKVTNDNLVGLQFLEPLHRERGETALDKNYVVVNVVLYTEGDGRNCEGSCYCRNIHLKE